ncbi:UNVERIFIED_CONTAM: hypothetical protein NCL1_10301 [Trichonephila clavipes]
MIEKWVASIESFGSTALSSSTGRNSGKLSLSYCNQGARLRPLLNCLVSNFIRKFLEKEGSWKFLEGSVLDFLSDAIFFAKFVAKGNKVANGYLSYIFCGCHSHNFQVDGKKQLCQ